MWCLIFLSWSVADLWRDCDDKQWAEQAARPWDGHAQRKSRNQEQRLRYLIYISKYLFMNYKKRRRSKMNHYCVQRWNVVTTRSVHNNCMYLWNKTQATIIIVKEWKSRSLCALFFNSLRVENTSLAQSNFIWFVHAQNSTAFKTNEMYYMRRRERRLVDFCISLRLAANCKVKWKKRSIILLLYKITCLYTRE